ncbi:DMT family transporter [Limnohabitans sp.]|uniref:DMT family transporter n=2 Tax=Limnohabitans sp. TaxID=1907725 RepID=UPI0030E30680
MLDICIDRFNHDSGMNNKSLRGMAMVVFAAMLWGTTGTAQSFAPPQLSSYWVGALRLLVAAVFFWPLLWIQDRSIFTGALMRQLPWRGIGLAAVCMCVYNLAFFAGVRDTGVAVGTALALGSGPVWAGLLQVVINRQLPKRVWWVGTGIAVAGVVAMVTGNSERASVSWTGVLMCLMAGLSYATYAIANQHMVSNASPSTVTATVFTMAALMAIPGASMLSGRPDIHTGDVAIVLWLGVVSTGIAYLIFSHALRHVSAATGVVLALAEPVTAFALAILVVGEQPGISGGLGLATVLLGLWLVVRSEMLSIK